MSGNCICDFMATAIRRNLPRHKNKNEQQGCRGGFASPPNHIECLCSLVATELQQQNFLLHMDFA